jgi:hypothetical protein
MGFCKIEDFLYEKFIITEHECNHLYEKAYFTQFLRTLVKFTQYDLTLLKYEIRIWDHLKDWLKLKKSMSFQVNMYSHILMMGAIPILYFEKLICKCSF